MLSKFLQWNMIPQLKRAWDMVRLNNEKEAREGVRRVCEGGKEGEGYKVEKGGGVEERDCKGGV